jgi:outer membrane protein assembly factor BamB
MKNRFVLFAGILSASAATSLASALEWPEFRGPGMQGISAATNVPTKWSSTENVAWKTPSHAGWSSPVVSAGKIYLTGSTNLNGGVSLRVMAYDLATGKNLWDVEAIHGDAGTAGTKHQKNGVASPTPIIRDGKIYAHFGHLGTAALDLTGKVLWRQTEIKYPPVHGNGGSPALVGDRLIFSCDGGSDPFLAALNAKTGAIEWKTPRNTRASKPFSFATPLVIQNDGADQLISPCSGFVGGYDPKTGRELWRVRYGEGYSVIARPVFAHGLLFVSSSYDRPSIYAVNPKGATGDSTEKAIAWSQAKGAPNTPSLLAVGDELYSVSDAGIATCWDAKTGETHWAERLGGGMSASPTLVESRVYFQNEEGIGYVVKASKTFELLAKNDLNERTLATPAPIDNALLIRSANFLWKIAQ